MKSPPLILAVGQSGEEFGYMTDKALIRSETSADISTITEVTVAAFKSLEISNHTEQFILEALRGASDF